MVDDLDFDRLDGDFDGNHDAFGDDFRARSSSSLTARKASFRVGSRNLGGTEEDQMRINEVECKMKEMQTHISQKL